MLLVKFYEFLNLENTGFAHPDGINFAFYLVLGIFILLHFKF